ncbi:AVAST type 3 anti-phage protein Avs3b [Xanthobacter sp. V2C-4]|uniref:AVAST type 3 anti-phage proein Avs3b n=1 Tax=Xanthobacter albus TaxID=3119929 RepID=UPI00372AD73A
MALGCKLVEELGLDDSVDTLGRWMAHHIADLIAKAESATGEEKRSAEKNCFDAILALWHHRAELPNGKRPFEELEPVVRAIESLDPDDDTPRYFRSARMPAGDKKEESEAEAWLKIVDGLDYSAKILIGHCLAEAARTAVDRSKEWVKLAEAAETDCGVSEIVVRFVSSTADLDQEPDLVAERRRLKEDRLARLESFVKLAEIVVSGWRRNIETDPPSATSRSTRSVKAKSPRSARKRTGPSSA